MSYVYTSGISPLSCFCRFENRSKVLMDNVQSPKRYWTARFIRYGIPSMQYYLW